MRKLGHFDRPGIVDLAVRLPAKVIVWLSSRFNSFGLIKAAPYIAPMAGQILAQHLTAPEPTARETITPARARELYGTRGAVIPTAS